jgi:DNA-binding transcriptional regulator GbsR (MarR family)
MEKMTYVMALDSAIACSALSDEVREKLTALREQQAKRNTAEKKPTKTQQENAEVAQTLYDEMLACGKALTVSDMLAEFECVKGMSNQKVSALVRKLKDAGKVEKSVEGRKSFFKALA